MQRLPVIKPNKTLRGNELDMSEVPLVGQELYDCIVKSVEATQSAFIITQLPDVLKVTQKQFASLNNFTQEMYNTTDRFMLTPHNAMEVEIVRTHDQVEEIEQVMAETDKLKDSVKNNDPSEVLDA